MTKSQKWKNQTCIWTGHISLHIIWAALWASPYSFHVSSCQYWKAYIREQQNDKQNMTELTYPAVISFFLAWISISWQRVVAAKPRSEPWRVKMKRGCILLHIKYLHLQEKLWLIPALKILMYSNLIQLRLHLAVVWGGKCSSLTAQHSTAFTSHSPSLSVLLCDALWVAHSELMGGFSANNKPENLISSTDVWAELLVQPWIAQMSFSCSSLSRHLLEPLTDIARWVVTIILWEKPYVTSQIVPSFPLVSLLFPPVELCRAEWLRDSDNHTVVCTALRHSLCVCTRVGWQQPL